MCDWVFVEVVSSQVEACKLQLQLHGAHSVTKESHSALQNHYHVGSPVLAPRKNALYTSFACLVGFPTYFLFSVLIFPNLSTFLFTFFLGPLCFQATGCKRQANIGLGCFSLF